MGISYSDSESGGGLVIRATLVVKGTIKRNLVAVVVVALAGKVGGMIMAMCFQLVLSWGTMGEDWRSLCVHRLAANRHADDGRG